MTTLQITGQKLDKVLQCFYLFIYLFIIYCKTTYKDIQYTTLLILLALLTTQYYITFSFTYAHTLNEKKKKKKKRNKRKGKERTTCTYYMCALVTYKNKVEITYSWVVQETKYTCNYFSMGSTIIFSQKSG